MPNSTFTIAPLERKRRKQDPREYFPGMTVKVDDIFLKHLDWGGRTMSTPQLTCAVFTPAAPEGADEAFRGVLRCSCTGEFIGAPTLHALLDYLGTKEGMRHLAIPDGEDEINLVLGYMHKGDDVLVLYVEHEYEQDEREIHLHARPVGQWRKDLPRVLVIFDEKE